MTEIIVYPIFIVMFMYFGIKWQMRKAHPVWVAIDWFACGVYVTLLAIEVSKLIG